MYDFQYNDHSIVGAKVPEANRKAIWGKGLTHYLGNEVAARVTAWSKAQVADAVAAHRKANGLTDDVAIDGSAFAPTVEVIKAKQHEFRLEAIERLYDGEIGAGSRGPRVDPLTSAINSIAKAEVLVLLKSMGINRFPKEGEAIKFGDGTTRTADELVANWLNGVDKKGSFGKPGEDNRPRITKAAERKIVDAKKAQEKANSHGHLTVSDLGL